MRGSFGEARESFWAASERARNEHRITDHVWLRMGWAEVLYTDCREEEAQSVFRDEIDPVLADVPTSLRVVADLNRTTVGLAIWDPESTRQFYRLLDLQRFAGLDARDEGTLLFGEDASRSARYFDSVPTFWRAVLEAHKSGHWQSLYSAYKRLGVECTKAGLAQNAVYCAIRSLDESLVPAAAELLCDCRDSRVVANAVNTAVGLSNLLRHAKVSVALVCALADFVPEEDFAALLDWVLGKAVLEPWNRTSGSAIEAIWKSLSKAAWRFDRAQSQCVVESVLKHPFASTASRYRSAAITLLSACVPLIAPEELKPVANWSVDVLQEGLPTETEDVVRLLAAIAMRADAATKAWLAERLGFANRGKAAAVHERIFRALGLRPADDDLKRLAADAARQIGLQVQRGTPGFTPDTNVSYSLQAGSTSNSDAVFVFIPGGAYAFDSVVAHAKYLERTSIGQLFSASLAQIENPDNALANKCFLVEDIAELIPYLSETEADRLMVVLERIASGCVGESHFVGANTNPLSPFQANLGTTADIQARAVLAVAKLAARFFERFGTRAVNTVCKALADGSKTVRSGAIASMKQFPVVSEDLVLGALAATRDRDLDVGTSTFSMLSSQDNVHLDALQKRFLIFSIRQALGTPNVRLRWAAARVLTAPVLMDLPEDLLAIRDEIQRYIAADPSRAVKSLVTCFGAGPGGSPADAD
jgi:hypothetical protein